MILLQSKIYQKDRKEQSGTIQLLVSDSQNNIYGITSALTFEAGGSYQIVTPTGSNKISWSKNIVDIQSVDQNSCLNGVQFVCFHGLDLFEASLTDVSDCEYFIPKVNSKLKLGPTDDDALLQVITINSRLSIPSKDGGDSRIANGLIKAKFVEPFPVENKLKSGQLLFNDNDQPAGIIVGSTSDYVILAPIENILKQSMLSLVEKTQIDIIGTSDEPNWIEPSSLSSDGFLHAYDGSLDKEFFIFSWIDAGLNKRNRGDGKHSFKPFEEYFDNGNTIIDQIKSWQSAEIPSFCSDDDSITFDEWIEMSMYLHFNSHLTGL